MFAEAFALVVGAGEPGFRGRGGGARSGSELSHLGLERNNFSFIRFYGDDCLCQKALTLVLTTVPNSRSRNARAGPFLGRENLPLNSLCMTIGQIIGCKMCVVEECGYQ